MQCSLDLIKPSYVTYSSCILTSQSFCSLHFTSQQLGKLTVQSHFSLYWHMLSMHLQYFLTTPGGSSIYTALCFALLCTGWLWACDLCRLLFVSPFFPFLCWKPSQHETKEKDQDRRRWTHYDTFLCTSIVYLLITSVRNTLIC